MNTPRAFCAATIVATSAFAATALADLFPTPREQAARDSWARMWADARVQKIYGGTNEIMKELIARGL